MMPAIFSQMSVFRTSIINQPVLPSQDGIFKMCKKTWLTCLNQARGQLLIINPGLCLVFDYLSLACIEIQSNYKVKRKRKNTEYP